MEKIQELTEKLYREGVERGQAEAAKIKAEAEAEAQKSWTMPVSRHRPSRRRPRRRPPSWMPTPRAS